MIDLPRWTTRKCHSNIKVFDVPGSRLARNACGRCGSKGRSCSSAAGRKTGKGSEGIKSWWELESVIQIPDDDQDETSPDVTTPTKKLVKKVALHGRNTQEPCQFLSEAAISTVPGIRALERQSIVARWLTTNKQASPDRFQSTTALEDTPECESASRIERGILESSETDESSGQGHDMIEGAQMVE